MASRDVLINILTKGDAAGAKQVGKSLDQMAEKATRAGKTLSLSVTAPLTALAGVAVKFAADAAESADKLDAVFGPATDRINAKIAEMRDTIPATTAELQNLFSGIQDLLVPLGIAPAEAEKMSGKIVELAGDLASFNNIPISEALASIRSGLVGQFEPLLKFGVALNATTIKAKAFEQGIGDGKRELTAAERAQVTFQAVLEGTAAAHGNAADTADSAANQVKFLKSEAIELMTVIGEQLLPAVTPLVSGLKDAARAAQNLNPLFIQLGVGLGAIAAVAGPTLIVLGATIKSLRTIASVAPAAAGGLKAVGAAALKAAPHLAALAAGYALGTVIEQTFDLSGKVGHLADKWEEFRKVSIKGSEELKVGLEAAINSADSLESKITEIDAARDRAAEIAKQSREEAAAGNRRQADALADQAAGLFEIVRAERIKLGLVEEQSRAQEAVTAVVDDRYTLNRAELDILREMTDPRRELAESANLEHRLLLARIDGNKELIAQIEQQIELSNTVIGDFELDNEILRARIAGNDELLESLRDQRKEAEIIARLQEGGVTAGEAARLAEERVRLEREATAAEKKRRDEARNEPTPDDGNDDLRTRLGLLDQVGQKETQQRQLKDGVRTETLIDAGGRRGQQFIQNGRVIDESQAFEGPAPASQISNSQSQIPAPAPQAQAPDTAPVEQALSAVTLDLSPLVAAVQTMATRLQTQIDNNASRIEQIGN